MAKILIIEDDPNSARIVQRILTRRGHDVKHAKEGLTGLRMASDGVFDLVLLDMGLPDVGGHTIAALINRLPGDLPVVAVSASTDTVTRRRAQTYGCDGYITKPIDTRRFPEQVEVYIKNMDSIHDDAEDEEDEAPQSDSRTAF